MPCWPKSKLKRSTKPEDKADQQFEQKSSERRNNQSGTSELEHSTQELLTVEDQGNVTSPEGYPGYAVAGMAQGITSFQERHLPYTDEITLYHYTSAAGYDAILATGVVLCGPGACGTGNPPLCSKNPLFLPFF